MNELARLYEMASKGVIEGALAPVQEAPPIWNLPAYLRHSRQAREADAIAKAFSREMAVAVTRSQKAAEQGGVINPAFDAMGLYDNGQGVQEKTEITFGLLRAYAHNCEPARAIIDRRVQQVSAFGEKVQVRRGRPQKPGWRIRMTSGEEEPDAATERKMKLLERFFEGGGFCDPPEEERPLNWEPGFVPFIRQFVRDSLTMDWAVMRRWESAKDPKKFPIVAIAALDAARVRRMRRPVVAQEAGFRVLGKPDVKHPNSPNMTRFVQTSSAHNGGQIETAFTSKHVAAFVRNPRTDEFANGYGYGELEGAINSISIWIYSREYNASRFKKDSLPRGILTVLGNISEAQLQAFQLQWKQMLQGVNNRWTIPVLRGNPGEGSMVRFDAVDPSPRDMEYHTFMFTVALWLHAAFGIHPEETGYQALSPFRPPLSEASPEVKLQWSQDSGLAPIVKGLQDFLNREVVWKLFPDRSVMLEFLGLGQYDEQQEIQKYLSLLQANMITPRQVWDELDQEIPALVEKHPAWDLPMPWSQGITLLQQLEQAQLEMEKAKVELMSQQQMMLAQAQQAMILQRQQQMLQEQALAQQQGEPSPDDGGGAPLGGGEPPLPSSDAPPSPPMAGGVPEIPEVGRGDVTVPDVPSPDVSNTPGMPEQATPVSPPTVGGMVGDTEGMYGQMGEPVDTSPPGLIYDLLRQRGEETE